MQQKEIGKPSKRGFFITFEGPEGSGKTTQIKFLKHFFAARDYSVVTTREPGGTQPGDKIRDILLDNSNQLEPETELFLMLAQRSEHLNKVVYPALEAGKVVLCDRYFDSSMAYQGFGRGLSPELIKKTHENFLGNFLPDLTVLLLLSPDEGLQRARHGGQKNLDRMESQAISFHKKVYEGYKQLAKDEPQRFLSIEVEGSPETISDKLQHEVKKKLKLG
jgi:dTMP kinase